MKKDTRDELENGCSDEKRRDVFKEMTGIYLLIVPLELKTKIFYVRRDDHSEDSLLHFKKLHTVFHTDEINTGHEV